MVSRTDELRRLQVQRLCPGFVPVFRGPDGEWPERPTEGPDIGYCWAGEAPLPPVVLSGRGGALNDVDVCLEWWESDFPKPSLLDRVRKTLRRLR